MYIFVLLCKCITLIRSELNITGYFSQLTPPFDRETKEYTDYVLYGQNPEECEMLTAKLNDITACPL